MKPDEYTPPVGETLPALTVWQPWATLLTRPEKKYETRTWKPNPDRLAVGDHLAIHSAKRWTVEQKQLVHGGGPVGRAVRSCERVPGVDGHQADVMPRGRVLSIQQLTEILTAQEAREQAAQEGEHYPRPGLGDYSQGMFAWRLEVEYIYDQPPPVSGNQRIWEWTVQPNKGRR